MDIGTVDNSRAGRAVDLTDFIREFTADIARLQATDLTAADRAALRSLLDDLKARWSR